MNIKSLIFISFATAFSLASCGGDSKETASKEEPTKILEEPGDNSKQAAVVDDSKGIGKFQNVELTHPLDEAMVKQGQSIYDVKCSSCHKLTDEKLVGPGWKGTTDRHKPEWIMNFITNVDEMLDKDPKAQAMLEVCMVKMPNQNLKDDEARSILEFMRKNDGKN